MKLAHKKMIHHPNVHFFSSCERSSSHSAAGQKSLLNLLKHQAAESVRLSAVLALRESDVTVNSYGLYIKRCLSLCIECAIVGSLSSALKY